MIADVRNYVPGYRLRLLDLDATKVTVMLEVERAHGDGIGGATPWPSYCGLWSG